MQQLHRIGSNGLRLLHQTMNTVSTVCQWCVFYCQSSKFYPSKTNLPDMTRTQYTRLRRRGAGFKSFWVDLFSMNEYCSFVYQGYRALTIWRLLEDKGILVSRRGVAKFIIHYLATGSIAPHPGSGRTKIMGMWRSYMNKWESMNTWELMMKWELTSYVSYLQTTPIVWVCEWFSVVERLLNGPFKPAHTTK